jgi:hypothetical protein
VSPLGSVWTGLDLASGALWAIAYLLLAQRGQLDGRSGVPLPALASALAWETTYAVVHPTPALPSFVVPLWLSIDGLILWQYLRLGASTRSGRARAWFYAETAAALACALGAVLALRDPDGACSGFAVNVVMSTSFVAMVRRRRDVRGQSLYFAIAKLGGTAAAIPHAAVLHGGVWSLRALMAVAVAADVAYVALLHARCRALGIPPWERL